MVKQYQNCIIQCIKVGFNLNVVFPPLNMGFIEKTPVHDHVELKKYKSCMLVPQFYVLGCFINFGVFW